MVSPVLGWRPPVHAVPWPLPELSRVMVMPVGTHGPLPPLCLYTSTVIPAPLLRTLKLSSHPHAIVFPWTSAPAVEADTAMAPATHAARARVEFRAKVIMTVLL